MHRLFRSSRAISLLLGLSAVLYVAWITEFFLVAGADPLHAYVSDLAATDQPLSRFFRATDLIAGVCAAAASALALARGGLPARQSWAVGAGWWSYGLFGVATAVESYFPLSCRLVADRACFDRDMAGLAPLSHTVHAVTSAVTTAAALAAMTVFTFVARREGRWAALGRYGRVLVLAQWAVNVWLMVAVLSFMARHLNLWVGLAERLQELLLTGWTVLFAVSLHGAGRPPLIAPQPSVTSPHMRADRAGRGRPRLPARRSE
ncbi:DUF998 domain-containing protein [Streptomyces sp. NPDC004014]